MQMVVSKTREQAEAIRFSKIKGFFLPWQEMGDRSMPTENTFRFAGRARSNGYISRVVRIYPNTCLIFRILTHEIADACFRTRSVHACGHFKTIQAFRQ